MPNTETVNGYVINLPGRPAPWGPVEKQIFEDIVQYLPVNGTPIVEAEHVHYRLFDSLQIEHARVNMTEFVINDDADNYNLRIEGTTDANLLVTDAVNNRVGVGIAAPATKFHVNGVITATGGNSTQWNDAVALSHNRAHNLLDAADHADVATYLNQALLIASSPTFAGLDLNGALDMNSNLINNVTDPVSAQDAATKAYVDLAVSSLKLDEYFSGVADALGGIYYVMHYTPAVAATPTSAAVTANDQSLLKWITPVGHPHLDRLIRGNYDLHAHLKTTGTRSITVYFKFYAVDADGTSNLLLLSTSSVTAALTNTDVFYDIYLNLPAEVALVTTRRLLVEMLCGTVGAGGVTTVTMTVGGTADPHISIGVNPLELDTIFVPYTGATADVNIGAHFLGINVTATEPLHVEGDYFLHQFTSDANFGPIQKFDHISASPAVDDYIAQHNYYGRDSVGNSEQYGAITCQIKDPTSASEDSALAFWTASAGTLAARMGIYSGYVGIGTTNPLYKLVLDGEALDVRQVIQTVSTSKYTGLTFTEDTGVAKSSSIFRYPSAYATSALRNAMELSTSDDNGNILLRPHGTGAVGIGTISPLGFVDISKSGYPSIALCSWSVTDSHSTILEFRKSASATIGTLAETASGEALGLIDFRGVNSSSGASDAAYIYSFQDGAAGATYIPGLIEIHTATNAAAPINRFSINSSGVVVFNETGVASADVRMESDTDDYCFFLDATGAGTVGIGFASPLAKLCIDGGLNVGGEADPGDNNATIGGTLAVGSTLHVDGIATFDADIHEGATVTTDWDSVDTGTWKDLTDTVAALECGEIEIIAQFVDGATILSASVLIRYTQIAGAAQIKITEVYRDGDATVIATQVSGGKIQWRDGVGGITGGAGVAGWARIRRFIATA